MKHVFYFMVLMLVLYELAKAINCKVVYKRVSECRKLGKDARLGYFAAHPMLLFMVLIDILGWLLVIAGLLTSQWPCFALVILLSLSQFAHLGSWAVFVDNIVTIVIYLFAVLNTFHFHMNYF